MDDSNYGMTLHSWCVKRDLVKQFWISRLSSSFPGIVRKRNLAPFSLEEKKKSHHISIFWLPVSPSQMAFGCLSDFVKSRAVQGRTYVNPPSEKSVNVNADTELGAR